MQRIDLLSPMVMVNVDSTSKDKTSMTVAEIADWLTANKHTPGQYLMVGPLTFVIIKSIEQISYNDENSAVIAE